jgi:hypothetical protein
MELKDYSTERLLDELARRCARRVEDISTPDLVTELMTRQGVDTTIVDPYDGVRLRIDGPAIVLTIFD